MQNTKLCILPPPPPPNYRSSYATVNNHKISTAFGLYLAKSLGSRGSNLFLLYSMRRL